MRLSRRTVLSALGGTLVSSAVGLRARAEQAFLESELESLVTLALLARAYRDRPLPTPGYGVFALMIDRSSPQPHLLGDARNEIFRFGDTTRHAEIQLIQRTAEDRENALCDDHVVPTFRDCYKGSPRFRKVQVFTTLEPCVQCAAALLVARVGTVRFLQPDEDASRITVGAERVPAMLHLQRTTFRKPASPEAPPKRFYDFDLDYDAVKLAEGSQPEHVDLARRWLKHVNGLSADALYRFDAPENLLFEGKAPDDVFFQLDRASLPPALLPLTEALGAMIDRRTTFKSTHS